MATLQQDAKQLRPLLSDEEYDQLLAQHKKELMDLKNHLDAAMRRQKQHFEDKLAARRLRRKRLENDESERRRLQDILVGLVPTIYSKTLMFYDNHFVFSQHGASLGLLLAYSQ